MILPDIPFTSRAANAEAHLKQLETINLTERSLAIWRSKHRRILDGHGTRAKYNQGCNCPWCRHAECNYQQARKDDANRMADRRRSRQQRRRSSDIVIDPAAQAVS